MSTDRRPNRTEQRRARALQQAEGIPYQAALARVRGEHAAPTPRTRQERGCWWCGASGRLTLEHVVPRWIRDALHGAGLLDHAYVEPGGTAPTRSWSAVKPTFTARVVCASCNNGWMARLEAAARPRLVALMRGTPRSLSRVDGELIARWGAKTALMFQALEPIPNRVTSAQLYTDLYEAEVLPRTLRVWIGRVQAQGLWQHTFAGELRHGGRRAPHFTALLAMDRLSVMVMGSTDAELLQAFELGHLRNGWVEVGATPKSVAWPPAYTFPTDQFPAMPQLLPLLARIPSGTRLGG